MNFLKVLTLGIFAVFAFKWANSSVLSPSSTVVSKRFFQAAKLKELKVNNSSGSSRVEGHDLDEIHLEVGKIDWDEKTCHFEVTESKGKLKIQVEKKSSWSLWGSHCRADLKLWVPKKNKVELELTSGSGDVELSKLKSDVKVKVGSGNLKVFRMQGEVEVAAGSGNISLEAIEGSCSATTGSGELSLRGQSKGALNIKNGSGDVKVSDVIALAKIKVGSGNLKIENSKMQNLAVKIGSGDLQAKGEFSHLDVKAGSGDISVQYLNLVKKGKAKLKSGSGNIKLLFPKKTELDYSLKTSSGHLNLAIPQKKKSEYSLTIQTGSGSISLKQIS